MPPSADPRAALERFIRWVMRDTLYLASYPSTVQAQNADDTLHLLPDDERVRGTGLTNVEIKHGLPGVRVRVLVGSRVQLRYEAGDRTRPYAACWDPGSIESISFNGGAAPVARQGDAVTVYWPAVTVAGTVLGGAFTGVIAIGTQSPGIIQTGAARVRA